MSAKHNPVIWFEIPVKDLERASKFYEAILGLQFSPASEVNGMSMKFFPMEHGAHGISGSLICKKDCEPSAHGTTVYFHLPAIDPVVERIAKAGGKVCLPRTSIGQYGFMAHFIDTEGNGVGLHEMPTGGGDGKDCK